MISLKTTTLLLAVCLSRLTALGQSGTIWIDKFDKANGQALTGGGWLNYTDSPNKGASTITPVEINKGYYTDPERKDQAYKFTYKLDRGQFQWEPYVALALTINSSQLPPGPVKAIAYDFKGSKHNFIYGLGDITDYAHYRKGIPASKEWTTVIIPFTELKQPNWGKKVEFSAGDVADIDWMVIGKTGDTGSICIDNVRLLRKVPEIKTAEVLPEPTISISSNQITTKLPDNIKVADWYNFNKAAYSLSFDDGLLSHSQHLAPILDKYQLKGTFYLVTDQLTVDSASAPSWRYGYWHQFRKLAHKGHEIGSHSANHPRLTTLPDGKAENDGTLQYELVSPLEKIKKYIPEAQVTTFAYPFIETNQHVKELTSQYYIASRGLWGPVNKPNPDWMNLTGHIIEYAPNRTLAKDHEKIQDLENIIQTTTIGQGGWSVYLAHDILPFEQAVKATDSYHPVSCETFDTFCQWLKTKQDQHELWIAPVAAVSKYAQERAAIQITLVNEDQNKLSYSVTDKLPDAIYNSPLSLEVTLPENWNSTSVQQGNKIKEYIVTDHKIRIEVVPDTGTLDITKVR